MLNSIIGSVLAVWYTKTILCLPKTPFLRLCHPWQYSFLLGTGQLHSTTASALGNCPIEVASPKHCGLHCNWAPSPRASLGFSSKNPNLPHCQTSTVLHALFMPLKSVSPGWFLCCHVFYRQHEVQA